MMKMHERIVAPLWLEAGNMLGESPRWDGAHHRWIWVDIAAGKVFVREAPAGEIYEWTPGRHVSLALPEDRDHLIIAHHGGISRLSLLHGTTTLLTDMGLRWNDLRCNDGAADAQGRLWIGTTTFDHRAGGGDLYLIGKGRGAEVRYPAVACSNGITWSPGGKTMYYTDSLARTIVAFDIEENGTIANERIVITIPPASGLPDGMACDAEGMLWIALWGGFGVGRYDPATGEQINFIEIPVPNVTACCFGGPRLGTLLITTAAKETDLAQYPLSGSLFAVQPGVSGVPSGYIDL
ncbi:SMP-30/gluconolactonase/LRE family protein [Chitinophaga caseinilytica]|uniref:SMP-30/gluconolactonase/LRE family protein n=1 Tax=Chitinophaga caseinilytica TaxID=2267521 RepID=A0ABZ2Z378_9BACT